ncbi:methyltransferase domain-containing protein [Pseudoroseomonas cervicalis]|uniref:methyltransferase domain-containing protein n=1 Tax=Teichococcus cervicalis TaxID=204525 RepID=UPI0022F1AE29|nr:methyltransferase domain-containing protein [Pseudoroseomonas cervicalis]WBV44031.1 methyltransferase domain-containing protein [Pseudoroseomonas cervicalis]
MAEPSPAPPADAAPLLTAACGDSLARLLAEAPEGAVIGLDAPHYRIAAPLVLTRRLTLRGLYPGTPILHLANGRCGLSVAAAGCRIEDLALTASGHRDAPLLAIGADDCRLEQVALLLAQGSGLVAEGCRGLVAEGLVAGELGREAVLARRCQALRLTLRGRDIARRVAAPAIRLVDCTEFSVEAEIEQAQGSAVTVEQGEAGPRRIDGRLSIRAAQVQRALSVIAHPTLPATGLRARILADGWTDGAVLLANARAVEIELQLPEAPPPGPAVLLTGGFGLRGSTLRLRPAGPGAAPAELVAGPGRSLGNEIRLCPAPIAPRPAAAAGPLLAAPFAERLEAANSTERYEAYELPGRCSLCGWEGRFRRAHRSERETLSCGACRASLRYRGQAEVLVGLLGGGRFTTLAGLAEGGGLAGLALFEPGISGPLRPWLRRAGRYEQSFYDPALPSGTPRDGMTCQDLMATSFAADSFDLVVTSDIFEHVREPFRAFAEIRRILRPGGLHVWTVPLDPRLEATRARVDTRGPEDRMILPPVYHGSGGDGLSLVYTDFGRDVAALLAGHGLPTRLERHAARDGRVVSVTLVSVKPPQPAPAA